MIEAYAVGIVYMSVCHHRDMPIDDVLQFANTHYPTGIESKWTLSMDRTFRAGQPNPGPCDKKPDYIHRLLVC